MIQRMLAIWSLVPLPFLNPAWTSGSSRFTYCWSHALPQTQGRRFGFCVCSLQTPCVQCSSHCWKGDWLTQHLAPSSVQFSRSVMSNSLPLHGLQHARLPCPSPTPGASSNSCSSSRWCHPTISSSVVPFSSCLQSFPTSGSFQWVSCSHQVAKVLEFQLQHQSFQLIFRTDFL